MAQDHICRAGRSEKLEGRKPRIGAGLLEPQAPRTEEPQWTGMSISY